MRSRGLFVAGLLIAAAGVACGAESADTSAKKLYSPGPMKESVRGPAENAVQFAMFNNWLNESFTKVPADKRQSINEQLYTFIDSEAKRLYAASGSTLPSAGTSMMAQYYAWAARLGVPGAEVVLRKLSPAQVDGMPAADVPSSFSMGLDGEYIVIKSSLGPWKATIPYYFMIVNLSDVKAGSGQRTQMAIVSTGFGKNADGKGFSQATLMTVYTPDADAERFRGFWLNAFGVADSEKGPEPVAGLPALMHVDPKSGLHTDVVFPPVAKGALLVAYMGLDGTYQWNRPHFADYLSALRTNPGGEESR